MAAYKKYNAVFRIYDWIWSLIMPLMRMNDRLKEGFSSRSTAKDLKPADIWIQAASAGEAYLAWSLLETLKPDQMLTLLITTNTRQGIDILSHAIESIEPMNKHISAYCSYIPFDRPAIMEEAVRQVNPKLMVLLETEIWPGLLYALKKFNKKSIIVNGRLTTKSLKRYQRWPGLWKALQPDRVLAISQDDADRFAALFSRKNVGTMNNIKFDRLVMMDEKKENPLQSIFPVNYPVLVFGSVRQEEEEDILRIITEIRLKLPDTILCLFPRHMHRIDYWKDALSQLSVQWKLRSEINDPVRNGTIILWDMFGELNLAYALANAVFVGGSLAPLGGQNFLEPLIHGVIPVIGPFWDNFFWVGDEIFKQGLAIKASNWQSVASELIKQLQHKKSDADIQTAAVRYIENRKGGSTQACNLIQNMLKS